MPAMEPLPAAMPATGAASPAAMPATGAASPTAMPATGAASTAAMPLRVHGVCATAMPSCLVHTKRMPTSTTRAVSALARTNWCHSKGRRTQYGADPETGAHPNCCTLQMRFHDLPPYQHTWRCAMRDSCYAVPSCCDNVILLPPARVARRNCVTVVTGRIWQALRKGIGAIDGAGKGRRLRDLPRGLFWTLLCLACEAPVARSMGVAYCSARSPALRVGEPNKPDQ